MKTYIHRYALLLLLLFIGAASGSCFRDGNDSDKAPRPDASDKHLTVRLNLPALKTPGTRAMSYEQENTLDPDLLNVYIIQQDGSFAKAQLVGVVEYDDNDRSKASVTVRLTKDDANPIRLGIGANYAAVGSAADWDTFREAQQLFLSGEWPTADLIPMWGELTDFFTVTDATTVRTIDMYRSLARIDVGLDFTQENGKFTEDPLGLSNFSVNSVHVFCTNDQMYVPTSLTAGEPHTAAGYIRDSSNPLSFENLGGVDSYVREIYVPEAAIQSDPAQMYSVVVGGFFEGSPTETFYRLNFSVDNGDGTETQLPILRNHRYVFNIRQVLDTGHATEQEAFDSEGSIANHIIEYDLIVLDESIHRVEVRDGNYFGLDNRDIIFQSPAGLSTTVYYQTDLPDTTPVTYSWSNAATGAARYSLTLDTATKSFVVQTLTENVSGSTFTDVLYINAGLFSMPVVIQQKTANYRYAIDCSMTKVYGTYIIGSALNSADNYIDITLVAEDAASLQGKTYVVESEELGGDHGVSFAKTGTFNFTGNTMTVRLDGSGILSSSAGTEPFSLRIKTNSGTGNYCEATIVPVNPIMTIAVISNNGNGYGYAIDRLNGGAGKVFNNPNNFGPYDHSIVKVAGFDYVNSTAFASTSANVYKWITGIGNGGKLADIVYIAYTGTIGDGYGELLAEYLDNGGVLVAFLETPSYVRRLVQSVFDDPSINASQPGGTGLLYPMPANPALFTDETERQEVLRKFKGDVILNGPFGDIRDAQIGEDNAHSSAINNLPITGEYADLVTVYSYFNNLNTNPPVVTSQSILGFKLEEENGRNMFFWGDGGLMSSPSGNPNVNSTIITPFNWDTATGFPIPMPSYGYYSNYRMPVYNSTMFCNVMTWAIRKSQELKWKRLEHEQNP